MRTPDAPGSVSNCEHSYSFHIWSGTCSQVCSSQDHTSRRDCTRLCPRRLRHVSDPHSGVRLFYLSAHDGGKPVQPCRRECCNNLGRRDSLHFCPGRGKGWSGSQLEDRLLLRETTEGAQFLDSFRPVHVIIDSNSFSPRETVFQRRGRGSWSCHVRSSIPLHHCKTKDTPSIVISTANPRDIRDL